MKGRYRFFAERVNFGSLISIHGLVENGALGKRSVVQPVVMLDVDVAEMTPPMLQLNQEGAQSLMDELWTVGLRPTQGKQSEGQVDAIGSHLKDMRAIAFAQLRIERP